MDTDKVRESGLISMIIEDEKSQKTIYNWAQAFPKIHELLSIGALFKSAGIDNSIEVKELATLANEIKKSQIDINTLTKIVKLMPKKESVDEK